MAEQLIDEMITKGAPADLKAGLAFPLPVWVICDMLGVPDTDRDRFAHWSDVMLSMTRYTQQEFGAGAHACLGQPLARTELQVAIEAPVRMLPTLELAVPPAELRKVDGLAAGGLRELPVRW